MTEPARLCPWCAPVRTLLPNGEAGAIWLGKGARSDGICRIHAAAFRAAAWRERVAEMARERGRR